MDVGTLREVKNHEYRVGLTPHCVREYIACGHKVRVEKASGAYAGYEDEEYRAAGAILCNTAAEVWDSSRMIVKVKEPQPEEYQYMKPQHTIFSYLHLASAKELTEELLERKVNTITYETLELDNGTRPLQRAMSEIAGRLSICEGSRFLECPQGGRGVLLGGVPGVEKGHVAILGAGVVGTHAAKMAVGLGAEVTVLDINADRLSYLDDIFQGRVTLLYSNRYHLELVLRQSDLLIGSVLIPSAKTPQLVTKDDLRLMKKGAVIVDVAIDQGGCFESSKPTPYDNPVFIEQGVVHYCVPNMPGAVPRTATQALTAGTLQWGLKIAQNTAVEDTIRQHRPIARGVNTYNGSLTCKGVADAFSKPFRHIRSLVDGVEL